MKSVSFLILFFALIWTTACSDPASKRIETLLVGKWHHDYDMGDGVRMKGNTYYRSDFTWSSHSEVVRDKEIESTVVASGTWLVRNEYLYMEGTSEGSDELISIWAKITHISDKEYRYEHPTTGSQFETRVTNSD